MNQVQDTTTTARAIGPKGRCRGTARAGTTSMTTNEPDAQERTDCPTCDRDFKSQLGMRQHHKRTHGESLRWTTLNCERCDEEYEERDDKADRSRFCSATCRSKWVADDVDLGHESHTGKDNPSWKGGEVECECEWCGETYTKKPSRLGRTRFCSVTCRARGIWNPDTPADEWEPRETLDYGPNWGTQREKAKDRDGHECQRCGTPERLQVHHIVPYRTFDDYRVANRLDNLVTLCLSCHCRVEKVAPLLPPEVNINVST